jgi:hypothetical protein
MRSSAKQYREELHRLRSHPSQDPMRGFYDQRDSFFNVYISLIPFLALEYLAELSYEVLPGGLVFPLGFLLFWAFYYTFYKPGFLEERLKASPAQWDWFLLPTLLLGVGIWFVKVTLVELGRLFFFSWWTPTAARPTPGAAHRRAAPKAPAQKEAPKAPAFPPDLADALFQLGLKPGCKWRDIHKQYRALAKQFHPDLNPDVTDGHRFMRVDAAYHKLDRARSKYFPD